MADLIFDYTRVTGVWCFVLPFPIWTIKLPCPRYLGWPRKAILPSRIVLCVHHREFFFGCTIGNNQLSARRTSSQLFSLHLIIRFQRFRYYIELYRYCATRCNGNYGVLEIRSFFEVTKCLSFFFMVCKLVYWVLVNVFLKNNKNYITKSLYEYYTK